MFSQLFLTVSCYTLIYEDESNHCSYVHYLSSSEKKAWKIQACMRVEPMTSAILVQCFNNWTYKPSWSWSFWWFVINLKVINKWLWIYGYHTSELPFNTQRNLLESEAFCFIRTCNRLESFTVEKQCKMICIPIKKTTRCRNDIVLTLIYSKKIFHICHI